MTAPIRVLVVDDSAFMRKAIVSMICSDRRLAVADTARNGEEAVQKVAALDPDVVTMDLEMPGMNGIEALRRIMQSHPVPVIMVSSMTTEGAAETLTALELGAVDYLAKQLDGVAMKIIDIRSELVAKIVAAAGAKDTIRMNRSTFDVRSSTLQPRTSHLASRPPFLSAPSGTATRGAKLVAIGCSTGGPLALMELLPHLPGDFPAGVVVVQHMPKFFTKPFADRMNTLCPLDVREAVEGDVVRPGTILVAPGGLQFRVGPGRALHMEVSLAPNVERHLHAPSVDVMMESVAKAYGDRAIGVILTGMGRDGLEGMKAIKAAKGRTVAQDEKSCLVYGMPKAIVDAGCADKVVPLSQIAGEIVNMV